MRKTSLSELLNTLLDDRYRVLSRLGSGGLTNVYLALDTKLDRRVVLKVLHPFLAEDPLSRERFERAVKAAARLSDPHVLTVLDHSHDATMFYLVAEYVPGHSLRDLLKARGALTPRLALALIDPVIESLAAAHSAGVIHRDVKPEKVLIGDDGRIKMADFGLTGAVISSGDTGALIGTVAYMAPEFVLGQAIDARSDIYAAGIVLYELLTGSQPFTGEFPIQIAYQHVNAVVPPPSAASPGLAPDLDDLVLWMAARDPEDRPADARDLLDLIRSIRAGLPDEALDFSPPGARAAGADGSPQTEAVLTRDLGEGQPAKKSAEQAWATFAESVGGDSRARVFLGHAMRSRSITADDFRAEIAQVLSAPAQYWVPSVLLIWLQSPNPHLSGAAPVDSLAKEGPAPVLAALEASAWGAYF